MLTVPCLRAITSSGASARTSWPTMIRYRSKASQMMWPSASGSLRTCIARPRMERRWMEARPRLLRRTMQTFPQIIIKTLERITERSQVAYHSACPPTPMITSARTRRSCKGGQEAVVLASTMNNSMVRIAWQMLATQWSNGPAVHKSESS